MKIKSFIIMSILSFSLISCSHAVHQHHVSDQDNINYKKKKHRRVRSAAKQTVIMGFAFDTKYVNRAFYALQNKCRKGRVTGINTRYSTSHGFFSWTNKVYMTGQCIRR